MSKSSQQLAEMYCSYRPEGGAVVCAACSIQRSSVQMLEDKGKVYLSESEYFNNPQKNDVGYSWSKNQLNNTIYYRVYKV